ncbi:RNA-directed DNA polymerase, eukaryota, Reverse transcriptase zinc-binding domain protein [Artemisia annua]|uniref:RNA-directed DNA polymerase, eukaryota, Reverse transcriptase zinc-binding domain protein n=1 Tax=Artemisia annua TaxID=35608 RepID=A0A2U1KCY5_ARTAN|nr:RNA-directed DNA polymerase, eukaryota, Reverse transcriptase zinc-binding domain protein [Artemisia annua]
MWIAVYAPQALSCKIALWSTLANLITKWDGVLVAMRDFNEVREAGERFGSFFNDRQADIFNSFISNASLIDVPLGGYKFTWTDKWGSKMSKLDRFLVSESFYDTFPNISGVILEKGSPDHRPILIKDHVVDFGPTPFRFFHSWLELEGFHSLVVDTWNNDGIVEENGLISFKKKLQNLKCVIREWNSSKRSESLILRKDYLSRLSSIDIKIDQGLANEMDFSNRRDSIRILGELDNPRLLSAGGRVTLLKSVLGSLPLYFMSIYMAPVSICNKLESMRNQFFLGGESGEKKMSWVTWKKCLVSKKMGGLGIGSIFALNIGLLFKWLWRFLRNSSDLWIKVIKDLYGEYGGIFNDSMQRLSLSPWSGILSSVKSLKDKGIDLLSLCIRKLGNGISIRFWDEIWCGNSPLKNLFPRIYMLDNDRGCNVASRVSLQDWSYVLRRTVRGGAERVGDR